MLAQSGDPPDSLPVLVSRTDGRGDSWNSVAELNAAAARGNPRACAQLGEMLWRGDRVPRNGQRALELLERAARAGEAAAAFRIGMLLDDGDGVAPDQRRALAYFRAAAAGGEMQAFHNVGGAYAGAHGVKRDYVEALGWLLLARNRGDETGADEELRAHLMKRGRTEAIAAGERRAGEIERELAQGSVAAFLPPRAPLTFLAQPAGGDSAAPGEDPAAEKITVTVATGGRLSWPGLAALQRAAHAADPAAQAALGRLLLEGKRLPADTDWALVLLERSAGQGNADAADQLADLYADGVKVVRDDAKAFAYMQQAAHGGSLRAIYNTGVYCANGRGTERNYAAALAWLTVAKHYHMDLGQEKRLRDLLAKVDPAKIPAAEREAAALVREIDAVLQGAPAK